MSAIDETLMIIKMSKKDGSFIFDFFKNSKLLMLNETVTRWIKEKIALQEDIKHLASGSIIEDDKFLLNRKSKKTKTPIHELLYKFIDKVISTMEVEELRCFSSNLIDSATYTDVLCESSIEIEDMIHLKCIYSKSIMLLNYIQDMMYYKRHDLCDDFCIISNVIENNLWVFKDVFSTDDMEESKNYDIDGMYNMINKAFSYRKYFDYNDFKEQEDLHYQLLCFKLEADRFSLTSNRDPLEESFYIYMKHKSLEIEEDDVLKAEAFIQALENDDSIDKHSTSIKIILIGSEVSDSVKNKFEHYTGLYKKSKDHNISLYIYTWRMIISMNMEKISDFINLKNKDYEAIESDLLNNINTL